MQYEFFFTENRFFIIPTLWSYKYLSDVMVKLYQSYTIPEIYLFTWQQ